MAHATETKLSEQRLQDLRKKIQDDAYVSTAIERIAELMAKELIPPADEQVAGVHSSVFS